jgi:MFS family permease
MTVQSTHWDTTYEWKAVTLLTIGFGLVGLDRRIIGPLFPSIARDLHLDYQDAGSIIGALGLAWGVAALFLGGLSDRIGRKKVLVPAIVLFSLLSGFSGMAGSLTGLLLIRSIMGVTEGAFCPTSFAATAEAAKPSRRGLLQGVQQSFFALFGLALAPIIATQLLATTTWRWVFVLVAVPGLITAVLLAMTIREPVTITGTTGHTPRRAPIGKVFKHRNVLVAMVGLFCVMTGIFVLSALIPSLIATEAAPMGQISTAAGIIIGAGEIFGGGVAPIIAGGIAKNYGIQFVPYVALGGLLLGILVSLFLRETAPNWTKSSASDLDKLEAAVDSVVGS